MDAIFNIYEDATAYQKTVNNKNWKGFERSLIEQGIKESRHYIIKDEGEIAYTFLIT